MPVIPAIAGIHSVPPDTDFAKTGTVGKRKAARLAPLAAPPLAGRGMARSAVVVFAIVVRSGHQRFGYAAGVGAAGGFELGQQFREIGRASCRERVCK